MNSIFGLMATSGGNFVSIAHLEIPLLIKMLMCQILIFPAVYSSKANAVAGNLFILRFLVLPHLHRERCSWLLKVRARGG